MKSFILSNVYSGFSFAVGYTPNSGENGLASTRNGQPGAATMVLGELIMMY